MINTLLFDLFLVKKCNDKPKFTDYFERQIEYNIYLLKDLLCDIQNESAFLKLDLPSNLARELLSYISDVGGRAIIVPSEYRNPVINFEQAFLIGQEHILKEQNKNFAEYKFQDIKVYNDHPMYWKLESLSSKLINEGHCPGGISCKIDKLDGHIWTLREEYYSTEEEYYIDIKATYSLEELSHIIGNTLNLNRDRHQSVGKKNSLRNFNILSQVKKHTFPILFKKLFNYIPNYHVVVSFGPYYENRAYLICKLINILVHNSDINSFVFSVDSGENTVISTYLENKLKLNIDEYSLIQSHTKEINYSYSLGKVTSIKIKDIL